MALVKLTEISHWGDASPDFFSDVIVEKNDHPTVRVMSEKLIPEKGDDNLPVRLTVAHIAREKRSYGKSGRNVSVWKMLLFDGSHTFIKAVTNSGLSALIKKGDITVGATLVIKSYSLIRIQDDPNIYDMHWSAIMLINNVSWRCSPASGYEMAMVDGKMTRTRPIVRPTLPHKTTVFAHDVLNKASVNNRILFTAVSCHHNKEEDMAVCFHATACDEQLAAALPVQCRLTIPDWLSMMDKYRAGNREHSFDTKEDIQEPVDNDLNDSAEEPFEKRCGCQLNFRFSECVTKTFKLQSLDLDLLFLQVKEFLNGEVDADSFDLLSNRKKRFCLYFHYACNIYQVKGDRQRLPVCIEDYVRSNFPNPKGEFFTGYKASRDDYVDPVKMVKVAYVPPVAASLKTPSPNKPVSTYHISLDPPVEFKPAATEQPVVPAAASPVLRTNGLPRWLTEKIPTAMQRAAKARARGVFGNGSNHGYGCDTPPNFKVSNGTSGKKSKTSMHSSDDEENQFE